MVDFNKLNRERWQAAVDRYKKLRGDIALGAPVFISTDRQPTINIGISDEGRQALFEELSKTITKLEEKITKSLDRAGG
jgi:hypothetical protein